MAGLSADAQAQIIANIAIGLIAVLGAIVGAVLGANRGADATLKATKQTIDSERQAAAAAEQRQAWAVRLMLRTEIDANLAALCTFWQSVTLQGASPDDQDEDRQSVEGEESEPKTPPLDKHSLATRIVRTPMPAISHHAWEALTPLIPNALVPSELVAANTVYARLATVARLRDELATMVNEKPSLYTQPNMHGEQVMHSSTPLLHYHYGPGMWNQISALVTAILNDGNPLTDNDPPTQLKH